jgi:hypothetical protein
VKRPALAVAAGLFAAASCGADRPLSADHACDGFPMPNPASTGLPHPAAYTANPGGTVTDLVTGLTWSAPLDDVGETENAAAASCAALGPGWRLPTRLELVSLVDYTIAAPGPTINRTFAGTPGAIFWTSSLYAGDDGDAWNVGFDAGYSDYGLRDGMDRVRCVLPPAPRCRPTRWEVTPGGLVVDLATGLTWQRDVDARMFAWPDALAFCAQRGPGWRLPSLTELQTIVDDTREYPAIDGAVFPDTPKVFFWTATPHADGSGTAWYVDFFYGATDRDVPTRAYQVRCVR